MYTFLTYLILKEIKYWKRRFKKIQSNLEISNSVTEKA